MVIETEKLEGETPLEVIDRLRLSGEIGVNEKATYAGRLDPMASGAMVILTGEDVHRKSEFMGKDKEYEVEILFGFATDTYDVLGKVESVSERKTSFNDDIFLRLQSFVGKFIQEYPRYSSKVFSKVPFSSHDLETVPDEMPTREVEIYSVDYLGMWEKSGGELLADIQSRIAKVKGNFRQSEILELWQKSLIFDSTYQILKIKVACGSGTYMRTLAHELGKKLGVSALAYSINRTSISK